MVFCYEVIFQLTIPFKHKRKDVLIFGISLFAYILVFLNLYRPFFLQNLSQSELFFYTLKVGLFTLLVSAVTYSSAIYRFKFHLTQWTLSKEVLWVLAHFVIISSFVYGLSRNYDSLSHITWGGFFSATSLVGIIPISVDIIIRLRGNRFDVQHEMVSKKANNILYVRSDGNYLEVYRLIENDVQRLVLRESLKSYMTLNSHNVLQVHRSYLINPEHVESILGNSNGGKILLKKGIEIPFSRSFYKHVARLRKSMDFSTLEYQSP